jgi:hypothetical protein
MMPIPLRAGLAPGPEKAWQYFARKKRWHSAPGYDIRNKNNGRLKKNVFGHCDYPCSGLFSFDLDRLAPD